MQENKSSPPAWQGNMFGATVSRVTPDEPLCLHLRHAEQAAVLIRALLNKEANYLFPFAH